MKSTIKGKEASAENEYPKLMEHRHCGLVVLFTDENCGTVVNESDAVYSVGDWSDTWEISDFHDFHGTILLEN